MTQLRTYQAMTSQSNVLMTMNPSQVHREVGETQFAVCRAVLLAPKEARA